MRNFDMMGIAILFSCVLLLLLLIGFLGFALGVVSTLVPVGY